MRKLFAAAFLALIALSSSAWAQVCPVGSTCNPFETYIYGQTAATAPFAGSLRIPAVPSGSATSAEYIAANVLATLSDTQTLTNKTINCSNNTCTNINLTTAVTGILPIANGGTGTATPNLVAGTNVTITGNWPNQTINSSGGGGGTPANPTATAGPTAVNGVLTTFMRSDAAPAIQKGTSSQFGIVEVDGSTITSTGGVISASAVPAGVTITDGAHTVTGSTTVTFSGATVSGATPNATVAITGGGGGSGGFYRNNFVLAATNTYTFAQAAYTLTDQDVICGAVPTANTGDSTINVGGTGAVHVKVQNAAGLALLAGGELAASTQQCFQYQAAASAWISTTQLSGYIIHNALSQTITQTQFVSGVEFDVTTASQTLTLPDSASTLLSGNGVVGIKAIVAVTLQASGSDTITNKDGTSAAGGSVSIPAGSFIALTGTGVSPTNFNIAIQYPPAATATVAGVAKLNTVLAQGSWATGGTPNQGAMLISVPVGYTITSIVGINTVLVGGAGSIDVYDVPAASPPSSCQGGAKINSASFNANASLMASQTLFTGSYSLAIGHTVCLAAPAWPGSPTGAGGIEILGQPS